VTHQITISIWIYPTSLLTQAYPILIDKEYINGSNPEYIFMLRNNYKLSFGWYGTTNDYWITSTNQVTTNNTWYHVAVTYDSVNSPIIYVNGIAVAGTWLFGSGESLSKSTTYPMFTGNYWNNSLPFNGTIDEVKIWNRALSDEEIYVDYLGTFDLITRYYANSTAMASINNTMINGFSNLTYFNQSTNNTLNQLANNATLNTNLIVGNITNGTSLVINNITNSTSLIIGNITNGTSVILGNMSSNSTATNDLVKEIGENMTIHDTDVKDLINSLANLSEADVWTGCSPRTLSAWTFAQEVWDNATAPDRTLTEASCSITVNQTNETANTTAIAKEVWDYVNYSSGCESGCSDNLFADLWSFQSRALTDYGNCEFLPASDLGEYIWQTSTPRTLTEANCNSTNETINNTYAYEMSLTHPQLRNISKELVKYMNENPVETAPDYSIYILSLLILIVVMTGYLLVRRRR
jgi:hypothetical protein